MADSAATSKVEKSNFNTIIGSTEDDNISSEPANDAPLSEATDIDKINGNIGNDTIDAGSGNDLAAGDTVGNEWTLVDGKWVYDPSKISANVSDEAPSYDDTIIAGDGDDVVLGNGGQDQLFAGSGDDTVNAGTGDDVVFGGAGDDLLNLEDGNDTAEGGAGDDVINAGDGDDIVYGDAKDENILQKTQNGETPTSFAQYEKSEAWDLIEEDGHSCISQSVTTQADETYTISFDLAANLSSGATSGTVEVLWNGQVVGEISTNSGVYETHTIDVPGLGGEGDLTFREVDPTPNTGPEINTEGPIFSYEKDVNIGGEDISVSAFAPGQAKLYQVIDGQLKVFDTTQNEYIDAGDPTGLKLNAIGFNVEDDLIYGIAKKDGVDALGNPVSVKDLVMIDADGNAYRVGEAPYGDYVGDFDDSGNLWSFHSSLNRVTKIDIDNLDADGNPTTTVYNLPNNLFNGRAYDIAYNAADDVFYAVESPKSNGAEGIVHRIDISDIENGGTPIITSVPITGTLYGDEMQSGLAKGAYGAVFLDGDGNLYYGLNKGDHDLDGTTTSNGAIYKVNVDWEDGSAYSEFMSTSEATGSNDGAVDPRSANAFDEVDTEAPFLLRNPEVIPKSGGNDDLRGGDGNDILFGGGGNDILYGGNDNDQLSGDHGDDRLYGGTGDDILSGGSGDDKIKGGAGDDGLSGGDGKDNLSAGAGDDIIDGGAGNDKIRGGSGNDDLSGGDGKDYLNAGDGNDVIYGGDGNDKIVGGTGSDTIEGGAGNDHMWGGNWWKDGSSDTFIVSAGSGKDMIHDFETQNDQIDLSSYGLEFSDLQNLINDKGWATEIDLSGLDGAGSNDKVIIKSVDPDDLDETNFIL
ncbi:calcium-binding protein [Amylibacter sp. SFDW26]|uniref:DUF6923 family protein n=1 Tax=Amylibacter sp. SFDW26 TaxID=2652722 RepID=UPI0012626775|nr:calcium-binding protein [Amylibacter sp. SFDW26]KAB7615956.1 calcium-binding protein [Amylibacter sp. SFDW26]